MVQSQDNFAKTYFLYYFPGAEISGLYQSLEQL